MLLNGLPGRKRRVAPGAGFITNSMHPFGPPVCHEMLPSRFTSAGLDEELAELARQHVTREDCTLLAGALLA